MAIIPQISIFDFIKCEDLGGLNKLKLVLENLPDEKLVRRFEKNRGNGRDDYPVRAMWNAVIAGVVFRHESTGKLIDELSRNGQLRHICGFRRYRIIKDENGRKIGRESMIPQAWNFSRFFSIMFKEQELVDEMFDEALKEVMRVLPDFGRILAIDGKAIESYAKKENKKTQEDGRRDTDANTGIKEYKGIREDGTAWEKVKSWFGYKLHLVVDAEYELPVAYSITKASSAEIPEGKKLIKKIENTHPEIFKRSEYWLGDKVYDDTDTIKYLWDKHAIKPIIDMKNGWQKKMK